MKHEFPEKTVVIHNHRSRQTRQLESKSEHELHILNSFWYVPSLEPGTLYSTMSISQLWSRKAQCNHVSSSMWHIISAGNLHNTLFSYNFTFSLSSTFIWVFCFNLKNRKSRGRSLTTCIEAYIHLHLKTVKYHLSFRIQYLMAMRFLHTK